MRDLPGFAKRLRECRLALGLNQRQLAAKLHMTSGAVSRWESENGFPDPVNVPLIATALKVSSTYLLHGHEDEEVDEIETSDREGTSITEILENARGQIADFLKLPPEQVSLDFHVSTSGRPRG